MSSEQVGSSEALKENPPIEKLRWKISEGIWQLKNHLVGKVLTIIDASTSDNKQREALKDLITQALHSEEYYTDFDSLLNQFSEKFSNGDLGEIKIKYPSCPSDQNYFPN